MSELLDVELEDAENYSKYRGCCLALSQAAVEADATLTLVRGHYFCPIWNREEQHWWTKRADGTIHDPSCLQFPSRGLGIYTEFNGVCSCANCGREVSEEEASFDSNYAFCSNRCHGTFVGIY